MRTGIISKMLISTVAFLLLPLAAYSSIDINTNKINLGINLSKKIIVQQSPILNIFSITDYDSKQCYELDVYKKTYTPKFDLKDYLNENVISYIVSNDLNKIALNCDYNKTNYLIVIDLINKDTILNFKLFEPDDYYKAANIEIYEFINDYISFKLIQKISSENMPDLYSNIIIDIRKKEIISKVNDPGRYYRSNNFRFNYFYDTYVQFKPHNYYPDESSYYNTIFDNFRNSIVYKHDSYYHSEIESANYQTYSSHCLFDFDGNGFKIIKLRRHDNTGVHIYNQEISGRLDSDTISLSSNDYLFQDNVVQNINNDIKIIPTKLENLYFINDYLHGINNYYAFVYPTWERIFSFDSYSNNFKNLYVVDDSCMMIYARDSIYLQTWDIDKIKSYKGIYKTKSIAWVNSDIAFSATCFDKVDKYNWYIDGKLIQSTRDFKYTFNQSGTYNIKLDMVLSNNNTISLLDSVRILDSVRAKIDIIHDDFESADLSANISVDNPKYFCKVSLLQNSNILFSRDSIFQFNYKNLKAGKYRIECEFDVFGLKLVKNLDFSIGQKKDNKQHLYWTLPYYVFHIPEIGVDQNENRMKDAFEYNGFYYFSMYDNYESNKNNYYLIKTDRYGNLIDSIGLVEVNVIQQSHRFKDSLLIMNVRKENNSLKFSLINLNTMKIHSTIDYPSDKIIGTYATDTDSNRIIFFDDNHKLNILDSNLILTQSIDIDSSEKSTYLDSYYYFISTSKIRCYKDFFIFVYKTLGYNKINVCKYDYNCNLKWKQQFDVKKTACLDFEILNNNIAIYYGYDSYNMVLMNLENGKIIKNNTSESNSKVFQSIFVYNHHYFLVGLDKNKPLCRIYNENAELVNELYIDSEGNDIYRIINLNNNDFLLCGKKIDRYDDAYAYPQFVFYAAKVKMEILKDILSGIDVTGQTNSILKISPNPANNIIRINFKSETNGNLTIKIFDIKATLINTIKLDELDKYLELNVETLDKGIYLIQVYHEDKLIEVDKFIKL